MKKLFLSFLMAVMAVPAFAVEFTSGDFKANIYGEMYGDIFYTNSNSGVAGEDATHSFGSQAFTGSSKLGVELSYGDVTGTFEAGINDPIRRYFLTYRIKGQEDHYLVIGRDTTIAAYSFGQVSNDGQSLNDLGTLADNRRLQVRYGIKGFELAVIFPNLINGEPNFVTDSATDSGYKLSMMEDADGNIILPEGYGTFSLLPRVEAAYTYATDDLELKVFGAYGAYLYQNSANSADDILVHSYNVGIGGQANFGSSFLQFTGWYGMNLALMDAIGNYDISFAHDMVTNKYSFNDVQSAGAAIGIGHTFADRFTPAVGVGYTVNFADGYSHIDDSLGAYINCEIVINDWFSVTPEIAYLNYMSSNTGDKEGYDIVAGVQAVLAF